MQWINPIARRDGSRIGSRLADCVESASGAMREPNANRIADLVRELSLRRLHDGQFDECDLTLHDLELIRQSLIKTLVGIYHGRISYPSTEQMTGVIPPAQPAQSPAARSA
jgi:membrane-associated HD superfamily phosphohydrolase